jgi:hypothetical protein
VRIDGSARKPRSSVASGRLRFTIRTTGLSGWVRLMVLDSSGRVHHRMNVHSAGPRIVMSLTGFARGQVFLVCAFHDDELIWSAPVSAG